MSPQNSASVVDLRREAGAWLKEQRCRLGLSQRELFSVNMDYTFISQIEAGRGRVPSERLLIWAEQSTLESLQLSSCSIMILTFMI